MKKLRLFLLPLLLMCGAGGVAWATVESATYISDLNASYPAAGDAKSEGDDHLRLLKSTVKATFPNVSGAVTATHTELNYLSGVTGLIQTQINAKAASGAVTGSGLTMSTSRILGRTTASTGALEEISIGSGLTLSGGSLSVATTNAPGWVLLSTATASNSATVDLETTFDSTYDEYVVVASNVNMGGSALQMRMKVGGAYDTGSNYTYQGVTASSSAATTTQAFGGAATVIALYNGSLDYVSAVVYLSSPTGSAKKYLRWQGGGFYSTNAITTSGAGMNSSTSALTGLRFLPSTGTITSGTFRLYGIKKS